MPPMPWQNQDQESQQPMPWQNHHGSSPLSQMPMPWQQDDSNADPFSDLPMMQSGGPGPFPGSGSQLSHGASHHPMMPQGGQGPVLMLLHPHVIPQGRPPMGGGQGESPMAFIQRLMQAAQPRDLQFAFDDGASSEDGGSQEMAPFAGP